MKILRCIHSLNPAIGGPFESVKQSSLVLTQRGHEVEVISLDSPKAPWLADLPFKAVGLGPGRTSYGYSPSFVPWIKKRRHDFDAVIAQGIWQYSSFGVWRALHRTPTPYFVFPHGMLDPWFKQTYPLKHVKKLLYWPWGEYRVLRDAAAVLFTSEEERRLARQSFALYRCREAVVNYGTAAPAVDLAAAKEEFFSHFPNLREKPIFLFLGRLHEKKGCDLLLRAFAASGADRSHHLILAGPARDDNYLQRLRRLTNKGVSFVGMLQGNLKWGALAAAEAFVLPSHQENFGIAVVEALASGTPVLISNRINIWREIMMDGAGLVEEDDLDGTTRLLRRWLDMSAAEREEMSAQARECFGRRFEIHRAVDSLLAVLQSQ